MPQEFYNAYNSLSVAQKQEVFDFVMFLSKTVTKKKTEQKKLSAFGCLHNYANPELLIKEEGAWEKMAAENFFKDDSCF